MYGFLKINSIVIINYTRVHYFYFVNSFSIHFFQHFPSLLNIYGNVGNTETCVCWLSYFLFNFGLFYRKLLQMFLTPSKLFLSGIVFIKNIPIARKYLFIIHKYLLSSWIFLLFVNIHLAVHICWEVIL